MFEHTSASIHGLAATAQLQWHLGRLRLAQENWPARSPALMLELMRFCTSQSVSQQGWQDMVAHALRAALEHDAQDLLEEFFAHYLWLGWPKTSQAQDLEGLLLSLLMGTQGAQGVHLGAQIQAHTAFGALGAYAASHFREAADPCPPLALQAQLARDFDRAHQLAQRPELRRHAALRHACCLYRWGTDPARAKALWRELDHDLLSPEDTLWAAWSMLHSARTMRRVRALDALRDLAHDVRRHKPEVAAISHHTLAAIVAWRTSELEGSSPMEHDRISALIDALYGPKSSEAAHFVARLDTHRARSSALDAAWPQALEQAQGTQAEFLSAVAHAYGLAPHADTMSPTPLTKILAAATTRDLGALTSSLALLEDAPEPPPAHSGAVWPAALAALRALAPPKAERRAHQDDPLPHHALHDQASAHLGRLMTTWAARSTQAPSYGWWPLLDKMIDAKLIASAQVIAHTLLSRGVRPPTGPMHTRVVGRLLAWVLRQGQPAQMRFWLELVEPDEQN